MKKVSFVVSKLYQPNILFDKNQTKFKVGSYKKYHQLYEFFLKNDYKIATNDIHKIDDSDIVLYFDMPKQLPKKVDKDKSYLLALESSIIRPENFDFSKHKYFNKIFTWNDNLVDNIKYIKIHYAFDLPRSIYKEIQREKLCCLIVSNKKSNCKNELYSERKRIIRWFEERYPQDFDLYGFGWNTFKFRGIRPIRALNKIPYLQKVMYYLISKKIMSYRGEVDNKLEVMKKYRFAIAYENVKDENGYITEKIFDAMIAGCVPVYLGAYNILDYLPKNCFIDRRQFKNNEELYDFIKNIDDFRYKKYLHSIENYLNSAKAKVFSSEYFAETIVMNCINKDNVYN